MATSPSAHRRGAPTAVLGRRWGGLSIFADHPAGELSYWRVAWPSRTLWSEYFDAWGPPEGLEK